VVTTYLVTNAIILTASSFLARRVGRKRFFLICLALFTASSVLCGIAGNLQLLLWHWCFLITVRSPSPRLR